MQLRIRFDDPGWFANDPRLLITVDGINVYDGRFRGGVNASIDVGPGTHRIETAVELLPGIATKREFTVEMPSDAYRQDGRGIEALLSYSRFSGNFDRTLSTRRIDGIR